MRSLRSTFALVVFGLAISASNVLFGATPTALRVPNSPTNDKAILAVNSTAATTGQAMRATTDLRAFSQLLGTANLRYRLGRTARQYTVLALSTTAIERVPAAIRARFFRADNPSFERLMASHVIAGDVNLAALADGTTLTTLSGETLRIDHQADGSILLNGVYRVETAQQTANGHVYTLDRMIAPVK